MFTLTVVPQLESLAKTGCAAIHCIYVFLPMPEIAI